MWKRIAIGVGVVVIAIVGWKLVRPLSRSKATKQLMEQHAQIRERLGDGLDPLFDEQVSAGDNHVEFRGTFEIDRELINFSGAGCAAGFNAAFADALGKDVVVVDDPTFDTKGNPQLELTAKLSFGGSTFQPQNSSESFQSVALAGDIELAGVKARVDVKPPERVKISYTQYGITLFDRNGASPEDIRKGIVAGTCQEAGYALLEAVTTWKRPSTPAVDLEKQCSEGFNCRAAGDSLVVKRPVRAAQMYTEACVRADDDDACLLAAALVKPDAEFGYPRSLLGLGCSGQRAAPCYAAGLVDLVPTATGNKVTEASRRDALRYFLRACDRGLADACKQLPPLLERTPFAEAKDLPVTHEPVVSKRFGTIFALRWGQWTDEDHGQPTAWVTKRPQLDKAIVREFAVATMPAGITAPAGVGTVYAVALERAGKACTRCSVDEPSRGLLRMAPTTCLCALTTKN